MRDWGYAKDYVESMWMMLQQENCSDYVISTGKSHSIKDFVEMAFKVIDVEIEWKGTGLDEKGINKKNGEIIVEVDPKYFRPSEVDHLEGDSSKAKEILGWYPKTDLKELVEIMVEYDLNFDEYGHD